MTADLKKTRIAIIGGGIVGLYLAWRLAEEKREVVVFEKKADLGRKPCSCLISQRLERFLPSEVVPLENKINSFLVHLPRKTITLKLKISHLAIDRSVLDRNLGEIALKKGVKIEFNKFLANRPEGFDKIIACDGALSATRKNLGLKQPLFRNGIFLRTKTKDYSDQVDAWPIKTGFLWRIPRGDFVEYGALGNPKIVSRYFFDFLKKRNIKFKEEDIKSHLVPENLILPKLEDIMLCGDSAGLTKPWSGGGIIWGLTAADMLVKHFPDFQRYRKEVVRFFGFKIKKGKIYRWLVYFFGSYFSFLFPKEISWNNDFID
jgi:flavin-dependent dehydrogenase